MNYLDVYKKCFSFENYSNCEHIQYNYVINISVDSSGQHDIVNNML